MLVEPNKNSGELSIAELFAKLGHYLKYVATLWYVVLLAGIVGGILGALYIQKQPPQFRAYLSYVVNEDEGGGGVGSALSQFGFGGGGSDYNLDKITKLAESQKIIFRTLLDSFELDGRRDLIANHIIEAYSQHEDWGLEDSGELRKVPAGEIETLEERDRRLLLKVYSRLFDDDFGTIVRNDFDEDTGILEMFVTTPKQLLSQAVAEVLYNKLGEFYIDQSTGGKRTMIAGLNDKADSLRQALAAAEYELAQLQDTSLGLYERRDKLRQGYLQREINILSIAYGEVIRNLESASFALANTTPYFQLVNRPYTPLPDIKTNFVVAGVLAGILFSVFAVVLIGGIKAARDAMR